MGRPHLRPISRRPKGAHDGIFAKIYLRLFRLCTEFRNKLTVMYCGVQSRKNDNCPELAIRLRYSECRIVDVHSRKKRNRGAGSGVERGAPHAQDGGSAVRPPRGQRPAPAPGSSSRCAPSPAAPVPARWRGCRPPPPASMFDPVRWRGCRDVQLRTASRLARSRRRRAVMWLRPTSPPRSNAAARPPGLVRLSRLHAAARPA